MRVALVHDYLREYGDAEQVLQALHRIYPEAPLYTAFIDEARLGDAAKRFADWQIHTTSAQRLPGIARHYQTYRVVLPYFWEALDLSAFDLVISSSSGYFSQAILTRSQTLHMSYCHTPPQDLWEATCHSQNRNGYQTWLQQHLRQYDFYAAQRVDLFVTNSQRVARRINKFYRRKAEVIPPPVKVRGRGEAGNDYYLYVGPLTREKQVDLAVAACTQLNCPLWVLGTGSDAARLQSLAGDSVRFLGTLPTAAMVEVYANAKALLFPGTNEDFGVVPVEAMGHGVPVIASQLSGMSEIVLDYRTGLLFDQPTVEGMCQAIAKSEKLRFSSQACIERAEEFSEATFTAKLEWLIAQTLDEHQQNGPVVRY